MLTLIKQFRYNTVTQPGPNKSRDHAVGRTIIHLSTPSVHRSNHLPADETSREQALQRTRVTQKQSKPAVTGYAEVLVPRQPRQAVLSNSSSNTMNGPQPRLPIPVELASVPQRVLKVKNQRNMPEL